jgi:dTDP-glucose 4,6-dehydratase
MIWLWTILSRGEPCRPYNVGSEQDFMIAEVASAVAAALTPAREVEISRQAEPGSRIERYIPATRLARRELGLRESATLQIAVRRTQAWFSGQKAVAEAYI